MVALEIINKITNNSVCEEYVHENHIQSVNDWLLCIHKVVDDSDMSYNNKEKYEKYQVIICQETSSDTS